ncbi:MAG: cell division protein SepF, partial [Candidatus Margulisbacteria bacterium]|nr:cell division protein SepF [Candidatus Margulisiibacteriota bacterium]
MVDNLLRRAKAFIGLEEGEEENVISAPPRGGKQMDINSILRAKRDRDRGEDNLSVMFYEPKVYEDSLAISGNLRSGCPVIINLRFLEPNEGTRLIDFVCGTAYAIDGHMLKIGETIFLFAPRGISIVDANERTTNVVEEEVVSIETDKGSFFNSG